MTTMHDVIIGSRKRYFGCFHSPVTRGECDVSKESANAGRCWLCDEFEPEESTYPSEPRQPQSEEIQ